MSAMYPSYAVIFLMLLIIFMEQRKKKRAAVIRRILANKKKGDNKMVFNGYEGKKVTVYTLNDQVQGRIVEIGEGWMKIDSGTEVSTVNLDYVLRVREKLAKKKD